MARALADYVARGGTLLVFCGPNVQPAEYNRIFQDPWPTRGGLLPARLKERVGDAVLKNSVQHVTQVQGPSPYLEGLVDSAELYKDILVYEYMRTEGVPAEAVLARLSGGDPLVSEKSFGDGRVLFVAVGATPEWSNLPLQNLFLPLMVRIAHLASRGPREQENLVAGAVYEADLAPAVKAPATIEISGPLGPSGETVSEQRETLAPAGRNLFRFDKTWNLGYYTWRTVGRPATDQASGLFATNPDGAESDLAEIADEKLRADFGARETHVAAGLADLVARFETGARRELWQYILMVCLLVAVCEPLVANWMRPERLRQRAHPVRGRRQAA
jgi:hypothetical protein